MKTLAIIPARGGSKGLPGKNIREIAGLPLIGWTIHQALQSRRLDKVIVSTDDERISRISIMCGAEVLTRPPKLAQDASPICETVLHALENNPGYDMVALLEPTSPLRIKFDIDGAFGYFKMHDADSLVSVGEIHTEHPLIVKNIRDGYVIPYILSEGTKEIYQRQQTSKAYFPYGVIYMARTDAYIYYRSFYTDKTLPYLIDRWQNYEIDDAIDFLIVENLIKWAINGGLMDGNLPT